MPKATPEPMAQEREECPLAVAEQDMVVMVEMAIPVLAVLATAL